MSLLFELPATPTLSIDGKTERFPVRRIYCVGRNYAAHAREMGLDDKEPPFFFMKPADAAVDANVAVSIPYPPMTNNFHYEVELVAAIGATLDNASVEAALVGVFGYAVGLDMTRRDLQLEAREKGRPWELGKSFSKSAPIGSIKPSHSHPDSQIKLEVNGEVRQKSTTGLMLWNVAEALSFLSKYEVLLPGDILMTGTPEGVGAVNPGEVMHASIEGLAAIEVEVK